MSALTHKLRSIAMALCFTAPLAFAEGESSSALSSSAAAELLYQIENLQLEVQSLRGTVEQQQHELSKMKASQRDRYIDLDKRISSLMKSAQARPSPVVSMVTPQVSVASSDVGQEQVPVVGQDEVSAVVSVPVVIEPANAETLAQYKAAYSLVRNNENAKAELAFVDFIAKYPNSELSGNSFYWLGLLKLNSGDPVSAIEQFKSVIDQFPGHDKETDTLYRLGFAYLKLDNKESAKHYLVDVVERFPSSKAAKLAKNLLSNIK